MIIAIDTGGTKTLIARFDRNGHKTVLSKFATPREFTDYVSQLTAALDNASLNPADLDAIVVAMPGTIENGQLMRMGNLPWTNVDIVKRLQAQLGSDLPVFVENDAHLGGLGEVRPRTEIARRSLYLTISTGINGGLVIDGKLSSDLVSAELGHIQLDYDGRVQRWEDFASGRAIREKYGLQASDINDTDIWQEIARRISRGFVALLPVLRPDVVIIGGGVGTHFEKFNEFLHQNINASLPEHYRAQIIQAAHPEEAVLYGCYYYAIDALAN